MVLLLPFMTLGQTRFAPVTMNARVSETVILSVAHAFSQDNVRIESHGAGGTLGLTLTGSSTDIVTVSVPILIRSNTSYKISGSVQSQAAVVANFAVIGARRTGRFAAIDALASLNVAQEFDRRTSNGTIRTVMSPAILASSFSIMSGPRISLAGTLNSADNALEVTVLIAVKPEVSANNWIVHLTLISSAARLS